MGLANDPEDKADWNFAGPIMPTRSCQYGFSLYELLGTLSIAAMVLGLGLPSFTGLVADKRLRIEVDALFHAVHLARKESVTRRRVVSLCPSTDGQSCARSYDWSDGWILYVDKNRQSSPRRQPDDELLRYHKGDENSQIIANRQYFSLRSTQLRATNGTLVFCHAAQQTATRALVISYTGRPRVTRLDRNGRPYDCAH